MTTTIILGLEKYAINSANQNLKKITTNKQQ
jgi:hypothetical protein